MGHSSIQFPELTMDWREDHTPTPATRQVLHLCNQSQDGLQKSEPEKPLTTVSRLYPVDLMSLGAPKGAKTWVRRGRLRSICSTGCRAAAMMCLQSCRTYHSRRWSCKAYTAAQKHLWRLLLAVANMRCVAERLNCQPQDICEALIQAMDMRHRESEGSDCSQPVAAEWQLVFWHACKNQGCPDMACHLCKENQNRRCRGNFADRYLAGDVLTAACGAQIQIGLVNRATGEFASKQDCAHVRLEMFILDGGAFARLEASGQQNSDDDVDGCMLLANEKGKPLLATDKYGEHNNLGIALMDLDHITGRPVLPGLSVTGSSAALLIPKSAPFRLRGRAVSKDRGARLLNIGCAVSEPFVVTTPRTRTATKANIPSLSDPVSKLNGLGDEIVKKLRELGKHVRDSRSAVLSSVPFQSVTTVQDFQDFTKWAEKVPQRLEELKKVLHLNQHYAEAREHAMMAVGEDNRMRLFTSASSQAGALFPANLAFINLDQPAALLERSKGSTVKATLPPYLERHQKVVLGRVKEEAQAHWWREGHPGWSICEFMSRETLHKDAHAQAGPEGCLQLPCSKFPKGVLNPWGNLLSFNDDGFTGLKDLNALHGSSGPGTVREACNSDTLLTQKSPALSPQSGDGGEELLLVRVQLSSSPSLYFLDGTTQSIHRTPPFASASQSQGYGSMPDKQPLAFQTESEGERPRTKRTCLRAGQLHQEPTPLGQSLGGPEGHASSSPFGVPNNVLSGVPQGLSVLQLGAQPGIAAMQEEREQKMPLVSSPFSSANTNPGRFPRAQESSTGSMNLGLDMLPSQANLPGLDMEYMMALLTDDPELNPNESDDPFSLSSGQLGQPSGTDDPGPT